MSVELVMIEMIMVNIDSRDGGRGGYKISSGTARQESSS